ncbi:MAG: hypothetical protein ACI9OJ_003547 [Myxococcota bacterium]|jgi:hypothetical protein
MKTSLVIALAALFVAPAAMAQVDPQGPDQLNAVNKLSQFVRSQHQPFSEDTKVADNGREDKVFYTRADWDQTLAFYKDVYANKGVLPNGVTCLGYFVVPRKRLATFTIMQNGKRFMLRVLDQPDGARFTIYGAAWQPAVRKHQRARRSHHRGYPAVPTRTYGL